MSRLTLHWWSPALQLLESVIVRAPVMYLMNPFDAPENPDSVTHFEPSTERTSISSCAGDDAYVAVRRPKQLPCCLSDAHLSSPWKASGAASWYSVSSIHPFPGVVCRSQKPIAPPPTSYKPLALL